MKTWGQMEMTENKLENDSSDVTASPARDSFTVFDSIDLN